MLGATSLTVPPRTTVTTTTASAATVAAASWPGHELLADDITADITHAAWSGDPVVVVPSPPGAGKTRLVTLLAAALAERAGLRVGVACQTKDQAVDVARRLGELTTKAVLNWSSSARTRPHAGNTPVAGRGTVRGEFPNEGGGIVIATTAKWKFCKPDLLACDVMIVDEAWQATHAAVGALGAFADQIVAVGDPGQIAPVVVGSTRRWADSRIGPHLPAPTALTAAFADYVTTIRLRHTWRLGPATTELIAPVFYPDLPFTSKRPNEHIETDTGMIIPEVAVEMVKATAGPGDPVLINALAEKAFTMLDGVYHRDGVTRPMMPSDIAVVTPHVNQAAAVQAMLASYPDILVGTANQLQGLERAAVVALHPLSGYRDYETSSFGLDTGRMCVVASRHRSALHLIVESGVPDGLAAAPSDLPGVTAQRNFLERAAAVA